MNYVLHILIMINIYAALALSLNLIVGYSGLLSLAQAAFYGIGAYSVTLIMIHLKLNFFLALLLATVINAILAFLIAKISLIFKGDYFALVTLGFQIIVFSILYNWVGLTLGPFGIPNIPKPSLFGFEFSSIWSFFALSLIVAGGIFLFCRLIHNSLFALYLQGIRDNELAFVSTGKNPAQLKTLSFIIAAGIAGIAGALFASYMTYIDPTSFNLDESIFILSIIMIGGVGNLKGPIVGTLLILVLPEMLRFLGFSSTNAPYVRQILYGILLIVFMRFRPQGIFGEYKFE